VEPSRPPGDAPCPRCGGLVWFLAEKVDRKGRPITRSTSFSNDLGLDSLEMADFVLKLEERFGVRIPRRKARAIKTVGDAIEVLGALIPPKE
jgi:acyl carrier protein